MKKTFFIILIFVIVLIAIFYIKYLEYKNKENEILQDNLYYEMYLNKQVYGNEITTLINKAININEKNKIKKDKNGFYIPNDENSIIIKITTIDLDEEKTYSMETIYSSGMEKFYSLYVDILFECVKIDYNKNGKVKYMQFLQKTT